LDCACAVGLCMCCWTVCVLLDCVCAVGLCMCCWTVHVLLDCACAVGLCVCCWTVYVLLDSACAVGLCMLQALGTEPENELEDCTYERYRMCVISLWGNRLSARCADDPSLQGCALGTGWGI